jgi:hypothetical protein
LNVFLLPLFEEKGNLFPLLEVRERPATGSAANLNESEKYQCDEVSDMSIAITCHKEKKTGIVSHAQDAAILVEAAYHPSHSQASAPAPSLVASLLCTNHRPASSTRER